MSGTIRKRGTSSSLKLGSTWNFTNAFLEKTFLLNSFKLLHMRKRINFKQMVFSPLHPCQPLILQKTEVENDNSRQGLVQLIPKGWGNFHYNNADPMKEGTSRHIGFTSSDSTDGLLSSFLALLAENCSSFSIIFTVKSIYLSSEKTEMLFGSTKFHTNQKDLIILQFYKHLCSFQSSKKSIAKTKLHQTYWNFGQFWENTC